MKELSEELNMNPSHPGRRSKTAIELGLQKEYCVFIPLSSAHLQALTHAYKVISRKGTDTISSSTI